MPPFKFSRSITTFTPSSSRNPTTNSVGYSTASQQFFSRLTTQPTDARKLLYAQLIDGLVADGVWTTLDALYVFAAPLAATALTNLKSSSFTATVVSAPTFTVDQGYAGDGAASYVNLNYTPSTAGGGYVQDSAAFSLWPRTVVSADAQLSGGDDATRAVTLTPSRTTSTNTAATLNDHTTQVVANGGAAAGLFSIVRDAATSKKVYFNGAQIGATANTASVGLPTVSVGVGTVIGTASFDTRQYAIAALGAGRTAGQELSLYNRINTFLKAIGAA